MLPQVQSVQNLTILLVLYSIQERKELGWSPFPVKRPMYKEPRTANNLDIDEAIVKPLRTAAATARGKHKRPHYLTNTRR
jgi:hypothetical protein